MKCRKIKDKSLIVILIILIGILVSLFSIFIVMSKNKNVYSYTKEHKNYYISINYKKTEISAIDDKLNEIVAEEKQVFIEESKELEEKSEEKNHLIINGGTKEYNELYFTHLSVNKYIQEEKGNSKDIFYIYDNNSKMFTTLKSLLKDQESFKQLSLISKHMINKHTEENKIKINEKVIEKMTNQTEDNYQNSYLNKEGLTIIFTPYKVSNNNEKINITIPWNKLNDLLKEEYQDKKENKKVINREKRDITKYKNKKVIAFTFDDGPNTQTTKILLDNLNKYDAKVTFFVLGSRIEDNKKILKRAYEEGNDIGSHTYSHKDLTMLNDKELEKEINKTNQKIKKIIGVEPIYIRPPYGNVNEHVKNKTIMHTICWNIDSQDWKTKNKKKIKKEILKNAEDGDIILLHDIYKESVEGALLAMKELKKKGYNFVTITEMSELKNITLDYDKTYYGF